MDKQKQMNIKKIPAPHIKLPIQLEKGYIPAPHIKLQIQLEKGYIPAPHLKLEELELE